MSGEGSSPDGGSVGSTSSSPDGVADSSSPSRWGSSPIPDGATADAPAQGALTNAVALSSGPSWACAVLSGGTVQCTGDNSLGELGNGTTNSSSTPVAVTGLTGAISVSGACALLADGAVECWGDNTLGGLGNGATTGPDTCCVDAGPAEPCTSEACSLTPVAVTGLAGATAISAGQDFACALLSGGTVECWGDGQYGELGNGSTTGPDNCTDGPCATTPAAVNGLTGVTAISVGQYSACAVVSGGTVQCWGDNQYGELGDGADTGPQTCCVGVSPYGPGCGGTFPCSSTPVAVTGLTGVTAISVGVLSACAVLSGGTVQCWGDNQWGELGSTTGPDKCADGPCATTPVAVAGLNEATAVSVGNGFACALLSGGSVRCWGKGQYGELGNGSTTGPDSCADGSCWSTPGVVSGLTRATAISAGGDSACALLSDGAVECWGDDSFGELGNGATSTTGCGCSTTPVAVQ
jgi:alpha-tubulin suppressor-like RCC1 family protein